MNREIKFRIWNDYDKKMINWDEMCEQNLPNIFRLASYNKYLMQFTGLKDKNGKEIYEGDIVSKEVFDDTKPNFRNISYAKVIYIEEFAGFYLMNKDNRILWKVGEDKYNIEVSGNIYDNPELLEEN